MKLIDDDDIHTSGIDRGSKINLNLNLNAFKCSKLAVIISKLLFGNLIHLEWSN
jgi:hypothetical protein